jgi:hypothetical protein
MHREGGFPRIASRLEQDRIAWGGLDHVSWSRILMLLMAT